MPTRNAKYNYLISCSKLSNSSVEKKSPKVIPKPSQNFLIVLMEISRLFSSIMLYAVDGVTPEIFANSFILIFLWSHNSLNLFATTSLTCITVTSRIHYRHLKEYYRHLKELSPSLPRYCIKFYALTHTHMRKYKQYVSILLLFEIKCHRLMTDIYLIDNVTHVKKRK